MTKVYKDGLTPCVVCNKKYHISDPDSYEFNDNKSICKKCVLKALNNTSWGTERKKRIVFDFIKVSIPHSLKWEVWERDGFKCENCNTTKNLSVDHITPESFGGKLELKNLQTLCRSCNSKKSNKIL